MEKIQLTAVISKLWDNLYHGQGQESLNQLIQFLVSAQEQFPQDQQKDFNPRGLVYNVYADAFNNGLTELSDYIEHFTALGVKTLWILPLLKSPGGDQGFDISDYTQVDDQVGGNKAFKSFLKKAKQAEIQVIFDIAINHTSDQHPWFLSAKESKDSPYRDYYHWSNHDKGYPKAGLIFKGMVNSNWSYSEKTEQYYLHRFYPFQPDLNYSNPKVLIEMIKTLINWKLVGVNGFRMDAAAFLWKKEGTNCENLPEVHDILKLFKASLDFVGPGSLLLSEVNMPMDKILDFYGQGDECQASYHFPLMPRFWQAIAQENPEPLLNVSFPKLPKGCVWFTFLRCHDEVTLDLLPTEDRAFLMKTFCKKQLWSFRDGQAFSGRLADLLDREPNKIILAFSLLFSLPGTPIIYYGDEIGMTNNEAFYKQKVQQTGFTDSRFLHRGPFDLNKWKLAVTEPESFEGLILNKLKQMTDIRRKAPELLNQTPILSVKENLLISFRSYENQELIIRNNLSSVSKKDLPPWGIEWVFKP